MAQDRVRQKLRDYIPVQNPNHYILLGLHPSASPLEIRCAYRELSKRYHPDTTDLPIDTATKKFQQLNEAYAILSNPERRAIYDQTIGYSRINVMSPPPGFNSPVTERRSNYSSSAYLDPTDRPLSAGEIFALFILGLTFIGCIVLAIAIGLTRGDTALQWVNSNNSLTQQQSGVHLLKTTGNPETQPPSEGLFVTTEAPAIPKLSLEDKM